MLSVDVGSRYEDDGIVYEVVDVRHEERGGATIVVVTAIPVQL